MNKSSSKSSPKTSNTLLNYFSKSNENKTNGGSTAKKAGGRGSGSSGVGASSGGGASSGVATNVNDKPQPSSSQISNTTDVQTDYELYDLVWAKLEGYVPQHFILLSLLF